MQSLSRHENKQHGTFAFPAEYYYITPTHPQYNMSFHWHKEWELIYIIEGSFTIHVEEERYTAGPGDVLLIRDGLLHGGTPTDCVYECFVFDLHGLFRNLDAVKQYLRPIYRHKLLPRILYRSQKEAPITHAAAQLMEAYRKEQFQELSAFAGISRLMTLILEGGCYVPGTQENTENTHRIDQLKTVLEYIENHYRSPLSLDTLANVSGMNPKYFCRFFRSLTHQTPMDYVNDYRIEQASQLLLSTDASVTDIGLECGFNDSSYFVKVFRKYRGLTPNQYRKAGR